MTDSENTTSKEWYWGELRSASENGRIERAWALLAAWPPELEPDAALRYLVRSTAQADDAPEILVNTAWMLEYYRALPVPMQIEPLEARQEQDLYEREIPLYHPWEGQVLRFLEDGYGLSGYSDNLGLRNSVLTEADLALALEVWFHRAPDGEVQASLRGAVPNDYSEEGFSRRRGGHLRARDVGRPPGEGFGGNMISGWGVAKVKGAGAMRRAARLLRRCSRELDAMASGGLELAWPPDLLARLQVEGAARHPDLRYVTGPDPLPPESQVPASATRQSVLGGPVGILSGGPRSWHADEVVRDLMLNVNAALEARGSDLSWADALHLAPLSLDQVLEEAGCALDSEAGRAHEARWQAAHALQAELAALNEAMRASNQRRREARRGRVEAAIQAAPAAEVYGEEVLAVARELMAATWPDGVRPPTDVWEAVRLAQGWGERAQWGREPAGAELVAEMASLAPLLDRLLEAAQRHREAAPREEVPAYVLRPSEFMGDLGYDEYEEAE